MSKNNLLYKTFRLYVDGFRSMTIGKVLWTVILIKLFVMFFVLKLFFFPDVLEQKAAGDKASYVAGELTGGRVEQYAYRSAAEVVCGVRRPIGLRPPSNRIPSAILLDSVRSIVTKE